MKTQSPEPAKAVRRIQCRLALPILLFFATVCLTDRPAWSVESVKIDQPSAVFSTDGKLPIISNPSPVPPVNEDSCLPLLKSVHYTTSSATDRDRRIAGKAAAVGLIFGVRFALGPKEVNRAGADNAVKFDIWQPRETGGMKAMAVAEYRRCKNEQNLKAISDWRWKR